MKIFLLVSFILVFLLVSFAQGQSDAEVESAALKKLMLLLNLEPDDIAFRDDYTDVDFFRLASVEKLMAAPYGMIEYGETWRAKCESGDLSSILNFAYENSLKSDAVGKRYLVDGEEAIGFEGINLYYNNLDFNRFLMQIWNFQNVTSKKAFDSTFAQLNSAQKKFLVNEFRDAIVEDTVTINKPVQVIDSLNELEEDYIREFADFGGLIRKEFLTKAGVRAALDLFNEIKRFNKDLNSGNISAKGILSNTSEVPDRVDKETFLGLSKKWKIGGTGNDRYTGDYDLIFDFGGDDIYELTYDPGNPHSTIIIDLGGDDIYKSNSDFTLGSACMSISLLFDMGGNDIYIGKNFSCGSGYFGFGLLYDAGGSDSYIGDIHTQGVGTFGLGLLIDKGGSDHYDGRMYAQGVGLTEGVGLIVDYNGNDNYIAAGKYPEGLGLAGDDTHYLSLSQGFAYGIRPYLSGGVGAIIELAGKDTYTTDIYGQGASYWWGIGMIYDASGYDQYLSHQYAQGTGVHMSLGILIDDTGNDFYRGKGLMQGVGHDYSCGIILDRHGDDIYQASDLSQAAGSANGIGILIDDRGNDAYFVLGKEKTHGYGNPRRDFGSMGLFLDLGGNDKYTGYGSNNDIWITDSEWGGGLDLEFLNGDSTEAGK